MAISVSDYLQIDKSIFDRNGAFDAVLDVDSRLFIDPSLLSTVKTSEFLGSRKRITERFQTLGRLLHLSTREGDVAWQAASKLIDFNELKGLSLGYSTNKVDGSGIGQGLKNQILRTASDIIKFGIEEPEIFELIGLLETGVGADRVSDMIANIIAEDIASYSARIFSETSAKLDEFPVKKGRFMLPRHPFTIDSAPILLVPKEILSSLPIAINWVEMSTVADENEEIRSSINAIIGMGWQADSKNWTKDDLKQFVMSHPEILRSLIEAYKKSGTVSYDFGSDPIGEVVWYTVGRQSAAKNPLPLSLPADPNIDDVKEVVERICCRFQELIENNKLSELLYNEDTGKPKRESATQKLFYGIADAYCQSNNLDLSPEVNSGRGPVDFKVSRGFIGRVLVETKLSVNSNLLHGIETQLQEYEKAESTDQSIYLVIDVGGSRDRLATLRLLWETRRSAGQRVRDLHIVDGKPKLSASKFSARVHDGDDEQVDIGDS